MADDDRNSIEKLPAPVLVGLPVERTLWHLSLPADDKTSLRDQSLALTLLDHNLFRARDAVAFADAASGTLADGLVEDASRWYLQWIHRFDAVRSAVSQTELTQLDEESNRRAEAELASMDQDQRQIATRLDISEDLQNRSLSHATSSDWPIRISSIMPFERRDLCAMQHGEMESLPIASRGWRIQGFALKELCAALIFIGSVVVFMALRRRRISFAAFHQWPHTLGVAAGAAWWLWLVPAWLGILMIAASLFSAYWPNGPEHQNAETSSFVREAGSKRLRKSAIL